MRLALPPFGQVLLGREGDVRLEGRGIADSHAVLHLDFGIGIERLAPNTTLLSGALSSERICDLKMTDQLRLGSDVVVGFEAPKAEKAPTTRLWSGAHLEAQLAAHPALATVVLEVEDFDEAALLSQTAPHLTALLSETPRRYGVMLEERELDRLIGSLTAGQLKLGVGRSINGADRLRVAQDAIGEGPPKSPPKLLLHDPVMRKVGRLIQRVAHSDGPCLILGETGTGKELAARMIHAEASRRSNATLPLVKTGAGDPSQSLREATARARGGMLLLDEVAGFSAEVQLFLGQLIEEHPEVRFLATSNHDLEADVAAGHFRKDLYFRLSQVKIELPPLRARKSEITLLAEGFLQGTALALSDAARARLTAYDWPGNVRELESVLKHARFEASEGMIEAEDLGPLGHPANAKSDNAESDNTKLTDQRAPKLAIPEAPTSKMGLRDEIEALERKRILQALEKYGNQTEAAKALKVPLRTFLNRMDALKIPRARKPKKP